MDNFLYTAIKNDVERHLKYLRIFEIDKVSLHICPCRYIRNRYLLKNKNNVKELCEIFNVNNIDDLSYEILKQILSENQYISSKPKR